MTKQWTPEHVKLGLAVNSVCTKLRNLANADIVRHADPRLACLLINLACELRRGFRPHRRIVSREAA